ncbi:very-short-patch-repair endonuclease [Tahibacter aquaticus]|uniref:Very-short-patch-repair endonuclease n=1 Tax=Tahibacter aquaticus TaxID=520092 RepID=A0A4R6YY76_9GAMM|nr:endonuclease domain-containing protein [Tahibacter aquaticus]TDR43961.1 very-short-patch-repair endonuclease [Tahibacter aquaticus]
MRGQTNKGILDNKLQRALRKRPTKAEAKLWQHLRLRQLDGCKFRRQHPYYNAVLDDVCLERKRVREVDGSQHADSPTDAERDRRLQQEGFTVLRFWNTEAMSNGEAVLNQIHSIATQSVPLARPRAKES